MPKLEIVYSKCGCATVMRERLVLIQETCEKCTAGVMELIAQALRRNDERHRDLFTPESEWDQTPQS